MEISSGYADKFSNVSRETDIIQDKLYSDLLYLYFSKNLEDEFNYINAELTLRAETSINLDEEMSEKVFNIMEFMDNLDDVQEVHTNAEFPESFEIKE